MKFDNILERLPNAPTQNFRIWTNGDSILCSTQEEANAIADVLDASGFDAVTGYYDPDEDERNDEADDCTGYYYVSC